MTDMEMEDEIQLSEEIYDVPVLTSLDKSHVQENEQQKQTDEIQEKEVETEAELSVYKPHHLDTETLIKGEIKQLILTEVSEVTTAKTLNDIAFEVEEQINTLKEKTNGLLDKNKNLNKEIEIDKSRLKQSKDILLQTSEMIDLLKEKVEKLEKQLKESRVHKILEQSQKQYSTLEVLKNTYTAKFEEKTDKIKELFNTANEKNKSLKFELKHKEEILNNLRKKCDDMEKKISLYEEEIARGLHKKQLLQEKLANGQSKHMADKAFAENEASKQNDLLQKLYLTKEKKMEKLAQVNQEKIKLERQLQECDQEINSFKSLVTDLEQEILQKNDCLGKLMEQLETTKDNHESTIQKLKQQYKYIALQRDELQTNLFSLNKTISEKYESLNVLNADYVIKCEEELKLAIKVQEKQAELHNIELILAKKQSENFSKRAKFEQLKNQYDNLIASYKSVQNEKLSEHNRLFRELTEITKEYEEFKSEQDKYFHEMKKKKEYTLATSSYLKEKCEKLHHEAEQAEHSYKNLEEENSSLKCTIENKNAILNDLKRKLENVKMGKSEDTSLKTMLKPSNEENVVKKVQFNEIISFKSMTDSSEFSSQVDVKNQLEKSFTEWLDDCEL